MSSQAAVLNLPFLTSGDVVSGVKLSIYLASPEHCHDDSLIYQIQSPVEANAFRHRCAISFFGILTIACKSPVETVL